jgi:flagellar basal-body rod protein FlgF
MADGIYVSMCGAVARTEQLESVADNLANLQTRGFKASRPAFESFLPASGRYDKTYPAATASVVDLRPGPTSTTGNPLDVVPQDGTYLAVQGPGGLVNFTRDGHLSLDESRQLVAGGHLVLGKGGQGISVPSEYLPEILPDGTVRGVRAGNGDRSGGPTELVLGELATFQLSGAVERSGPALLRPGSGGTATESQVTRLRIGEIELGNASPLETTVLMISAQRNYDASMQALQTYRTMDQRAAELGRTR